MHARELDGRVLSFGHRGWLWHNAYLLYDRGTDSIWHHQTGWAMAGPLRGRVLARYPTVLTTFEAWASEHPDTLVLPKPPERRDALARDGYALRNAGLAFGLGVDLPRSFRLYPFRALDDAGGAVVETVDGVRLVVARDRAASTAHAYRLPEDVADVLALDAPGAPPRLVEPAAGRAWSLRSGRALGRGGPSLERLHASQWETHAWARQHPGGTRLGGDGGVLPGGR